MLKRLGRKRKRKSALPFCEAVCAFPALRSAKLCEHIGKMLFCLGCCGYSTHAGTLNYAVDSKLRSEPDHLASNGPALGEVKATAQFH